MDAETILVGHSSGAVAVMRYTETRKILGSVLVAAYTTDLGYESEKQSGYFNQPWEWEAIKDNQQWVAVFVSDTDPYIPIEQAEEIAQRLDAEYYNLPGRGHFGSDVLQLPEIVEVIKRHLVLHVHS